MDVKILDDRANPLLKRHEVRFEVAHATRATPSREEVRGELSKLVHAPKERVIVERMVARYGTAVTRGEALVYESVDAAKLTERAHILVRNRLEEKAGKGTAPASEPATAEAPRPEPPAPTAAAPEAPKAEPPKAEPQKAESPKSGAHKGRAPKGDAHKDGPTKGESATSEKKE